MFWGQQGEESGGMWLPMVVWWVLWLERNKRFLDDTDEGSDGIGESIKFWVALWLHGETGFLILVFCSSEGLAMFDITLF